MNIIQMKGRILTKVVVMFMATILAVSAKATDGTWTSVAGGTWSTAGNWLSDTVADGTNAIANFSTLNITANAFVNNDGPRTVGTLRFGDTTPSHNWELTNSTLTLATSSGVPTIDVSNGSVTIGAALKGTQGLYKTGAGQLNIDPKIASDAIGSNTYSGGTYILAGTLMFGSGNYNTGLIGPGTVYLGDSSGSANAVLQSKYSHQNLDNNIIVQSGNTGIMQINNNGGSLGLWGTITLGSSGGTGKSLTFGRVDGGTFLSLYVLGTIQDPINMTPGTAGTVTINHPNGVRFRKANTYSGPTVILSGAWLFQEIANAVPAASAVTVNSGGTFALNGYNGSIGSLAGGGTVDLNVNALTVGNDNTSTTFSGIIANAGSLTKTGSGTLTLAGKNTYTGATLVNAGKLLGGTGGNCSKSSVVVATGATNGVKAMVYGAEGSFVCSNLTYMGDSGLDFDMTTLPVNAGVVPLIINGDLTVTGVVQISVSNGYWPATGTYPLVRYSGNRNGSGSFNLASLPAGMSATLVNNTGAKRLELNVTAIPVVSFPLSVWTNNVGGTWGTAANWDGGTIADGTDVIADFSTLNITANASVNNDAPRIVGTLRFGDTTPSHNWELTNSTLTLATSLGLPTIHVSNGSVTIGTALQGTQGLFKTGAGQLNIDKTSNATGLNTYSGGTYILAGTLMFGSGNYDPGLIGPGTVYLGDSSGSANAVLQTKYGHQNLDNNIIVQSGNTGIMQIKNNGGVVGLLGTITLGSSGGTGKSLTFGRVDGGTFLSVYVLGTIQDPINMTPGTAGTVTINHPNGVRFRKANTYSGPTVILSGWLMQEIANAVPAASAVTVNSGCTFDLAGFNGSIGSLAGSGTVNLNVNTLTVGNDNTSTTFSGIIANAGSLVKIGSGTLTLAGTNTYTGATAVSNGTLAVSGALSSSAITVCTGAAFAAGSTGVVGRATLGGTLTFQNSSALLVDVAAAAADTVVAAGNVVIGAGVEVWLSGNQEKSGSWDLIKSTGGTVQGSAPVLVNGLHGAKLSRTATAIVLTIPSMGTMIRFL